MEKRAIEMMSDARYCEAVRDYVSHFANPVRLKLLCRLTEGMACVSDLTEVTGQRQSTVSQQLKLLLLAGLVSRHREGTRVYYELTSETARETMRFLASIAPRLVKAPGR